MVVLTTVVVTVWRTLHVTNRLDTVTKDVNPDIPMTYVAKVNKRKLSQSYYFYKELRDSLSTLNRGRIFILKFQMQYLNNLPINKYKSINVKQDEIKRRPMLETEIYINFAFSF